MSSGGHTPRGRPSGLTLATIGAVPILVALCVLDVVNTSVTDWFARHAFTTSAVVSVLVLIITVLNVDRIARRRQTQSRSFSVAAQAAIVGRQARRAADEVTTALGGDASAKDDANEELRTYLSMLLVSGPMLIDDDTARTFLEAAQRLGGRLSYAVAHTDDGTADQRPRIQAALTALDDASQPLTAVLSAAQREAVDSAADGSDSDSDPG